MPTTKTRATLRLLGVNTPPQLSYGMGIDFGLCDGDTSTAWYISDGDGDSFYWQERPVFTPSSHSSLLPKGGYGAMMKALEDAVARVRRMKT